MKSKLAEIFADLSPALLEFGERPARLAVELELEIVPELPEVETIRRGLLPALKGKSIRDAVVRNHSLRYPVDPALPLLVKGRKILGVTRRAKYLLIETNSGHILIHLGMSGTLRMVAKGEEPQKHDHVDLQIGARKILRFNDPRRFGAVLWTDENLEDHHLLKHLGPEPLGEGFDIEWLYQKAIGRRIAIKPFLMDAKVVVGVGNIYASESLWKAGIHPNRAAGRVSRKRMETLIETVREVLREAIEQGGTTLKDYKNLDGDLGYFAQKLAVYGRELRPCPRCKTSIKRAVLGQRSTYWCPSCQR